MPRRIETKPEGALTLAEWSLRLKCHPETLRRAIRRRQLLATLDPLSKGPGFVVTPEDMAHFLEKRKLRK